MNKLRLRGPILRIPYRTLQTTSNPTIIPSIRPNLFTSHSDTQDVFSIPTDTYPNPLFQMGSHELLKLKKKELSHLLSIPYKSFSETDTFCSNIIALVSENLLTDTAKIATLYKCITDTRMKDIIDHRLRHHLKSDKVKYSVVECLLAPNSEVARDAVFANILHILYALEKSSEEKSAILLSYFDKLTGLKMVYDVPVLLSTNHWNKLMETVPSSSHRELYGYLVSLNVQTLYLTHMESIKRALLKGSNLDKFVARTGWLEPRWHDINRVEFAPNQLARMVNFFSVKDLKYFALYFIAKKDIMNANIYLDLLTTKFEKKSFAIQSDKKETIRPTDTPIKEDTQTVLNVILNHTMSFKGCEYCVNILKYIMQKGIRVDFESILVLLRNFKDQEYFEEAFLLINNITPKTLSPTEKALLVEEIISLILKKYPYSPKILVGYMVACYDQGSAQLLHKLGLLRHIYPDMRTTESLDYIQRANLDPGLTGCELTASSLESLYRVLLQSLPPNALTSSAIRELYEQYVETVEHYRQNNIPHSHVFSGPKLNDHVITLMVKYLLKAKPESPDMKMKQSTTNYDMAKYISHDFSKRFTDIKRRNKSSYLYDLLVYCGLKVHNDFNFATRMTNLSRKAELPWTFNQISPFILYHYHRKEYDKAKNWYYKLVTNGVKSNVAGAREIFDICYELKWDITGFAYRKKGIHRNYKAREALQQLEADPLLIDAATDESNVTEDRITNDLINYRPAHYREKSSLTDELAGLFHDLEQLRTTSEDI